MTPLCVLSWLGKPVSRCGTIIGANFTHCFVYCAEIQSQQRTVAALVSNTLLVYPRFRFVRLAFHATSCTSAMTSFRRWSWSLCLAQLTPAYGVTSMPFRPGCHRPFHHFCRSPLACLCCHFGCSPFYSFGFLHSLLPPSRYYASARPHVNRHHSPALHPVFQQLVHTASVYFYTPLPWWFSGTHP